MKAKILKGLMNLSIITILLYTMSIIEAQEVNWTAYIIVMAVSLVVGMVSWWIYVAKGVEKG